MKARHSLPTTTLTILAFFLIPACTNTNNTGDIKTITAKKSSQNIQTQPMNTLPVDVIQGLKLMYEEEKLALDVYQKMYSKWGLQVFNNIASTERRHQQAVKNLLNNYDVEINDNLPIGSFADKNLQQTYDELVTRGMTSPKEALAVGAYIEELDIQDLNHQLKLDIPDNIRSTYEWLNMGSRNHLRAFVRNMTNRSIDYQPKLLDEAEYLTIINSQHERGMGKNLRMGRDNKNTSSYQ